MSFLLLHVTRSSRIALGAACCRFNHFSCLCSVGKGSIDKANEEVRNIILRIWPKTSMELLDKVVQPPGVRK